MTTPAGAALTADQTRVFLALLSQLAAVTDTDRQAVLAAVLIFYGLKP